jgi:hypothetical protein
MLALGYPAHHHVGLPGISRAGRSVVERANSWHYRFRAIIVRWERRADNYLALVCSHPRSSPFSKHDRFRTGLLV